MPKKAKMGIGKLIMQNKEKSAPEVLQIVMDTYGFRKEKAASAKRKHEAMSSVCKVAANVDLMQAISELSDLYFKEKNTNAGLTYKKVAAAISEFDFEITEDNAKGLGKGKTKVPNVGKSSADKMYEFVTTGTIEKLEEKRAANAL
mmetsp:Transcript_15271/g.23241  ORF Transcript_15271/g.23241 Transcript_15271/m.23241 type:complete len:146 (-) Transcript_15271:64-501(-)